MATDDLRRLAADICPSDPIDLGIVRALKTLIDAGVHTVESCEGGDGHAYDWPSIKFNGDQAEGWRAFAALRDLDFPVVTLMRVWDVYSGEPDGPYWQVEFARRLVSEEKGRCDG